MTARSLFAAAVFASLPVAVAAQDLAIGPLVLSDLWTRATPPGAPTAAGYLTIRNDDSEADRLVAVSTPAADIAELHVMTVEDGVMSMRRAESGVEIPAGDHVTLAPGGLHIMFMGLSGPLDEGGTLPVTLAFEKAGTVETTLHILAAGARGPSEADRDDPAHGQ